MQFWLIDGVISAVAYSATQHFLTRRIKGVKRFLVCFGVAAAVCCIIRFLIDICTL